MNYKNGHRNDYAYKSKILKENQELLKLQKQVSRTLYKQEDIYNFKTGEIIMTLEDAKFYDMIYFNNSEWIEATKINNCSYHRSIRLKNRIKQYLELGECKFLTLTFTDDTLNTTSEETRKKYIKRYLKQVSDYYIANIDYGGKNGREHYHAIVVSNNVNYSPWHKYGAIKGETIRTNGVSDVKLGKYISKLTNHAIKETTKRNAIIYSSVNKGVGENCVSPR